MSEQGGTSTGHTTPGSSETAQNWGCAVIAVGMILFGLGLVVLGYFAESLIDLWDGNVIVHGSPSTPFYIIGGVFASLGMGWIGVEIYHALSQ